MKALRTILLSAALLTGAVTAAPTKAAVRLSTAELSLAYVEFDVGFARSSTRKIAQMTPVQKSAYVYMRSVFVNTLAEKMGLELFRTPVRVLTQTQRKAVQAAMVATLLDARVTKAVEAFDATF